MSEWGLSRPTRVQARGWGWRHHGRKAFAVRGLDLAIEPGERVLLLGPSGSGKSTLLAGLAGLLDDGGEQRHEGTLSIDDRPAGDPDLRGRVGLVLQDPQSQTVLARCGDDVAFGCENLGVPPEDTWRRVDAALAAVGLDVARDRPTEFLSGGQRQRLALAGVVAMSPGLLLLDEPTANLDPAGVVEVSAAVRSVVEAGGTTLIVVEHHVATWLDLVNRVVVLEPGGGVRADGTPEQVLAEYGAQLAAEGVWVPGHPPQLPGRRPDPARLGGTAPLLATALAGPHPRTPGAAVPVSGRLRTAQPDPRTPAAALLQARRLAVAQPGTAAAATGIDLDLFAGAALAVEGANGAGKTTLALTVAGLLPPAAGRLSAAPELTAGARPRHGPWWHRGRNQNRQADGPWSWRSVDLLSRIGMVFQDPEHQFLAQTVRDELRHGPLRAGATPRQADQRAAELLEQLRLTRLAEANPFTLSGGEKRRLSVATALATRPRVLVLDEPTFGQDRLTWAGIVALIADLLEDGVAALIVTHDRAVVEALADARLELTPHPDRVAPRGGRVATR